MSKNPGDSTESLANQLSRLRTERDAYKAVLIGGEYRNVEDLPYMGIEFCTLLGEGARNSTLLIIEEKDKLVYRVEELETASHRALRELKQNPTNGNTCAGIILALALGNK